MNLGWLQRAACVVCELLQSQLRLLKGISHLLIKNPISDEISPNSWATSMKCQCHPKMVCLLLKEISSSWETWSLNSLMILWWEEYCDEKVEGPTLKFRPPPRQPIAKWRRRFTMREVPLNMSNLISQRGATGRNRVLLPPPPPFFSHHPLFTVLFSVQKV